MSGFVWITSPDDLSDNMKKYGERVLAGVRAIADQHAKMGQDRMRLEASWTDRTGNARQGLLGVTEHEKNQTTVYFIHTVDYGPSLELDHAGNYAIVMPVLLEISVEMQKRLQQFLK